MAGKRVRSNAKSQTNKRAKIIDGDHNDHRISQIIYGDDDRISQLPDDILLQILSSLSMKEAVRTSVLSSRWQNLWKQIPCLNFDKHICLKWIPPALQSRRSVKREKRVKWVNSILKSHKATTLKEFRICLNLSRTFQKEITQWLKYALARHVQRLEFDLTLDDHYLHCVFPKELFTKKYSSKIDFKSLRVLTFKSINMTNEDIGCFLSNCTSLEKLAIDRSHEVSNLEVCGPSLVLKHLELTGCRKLNSVKISAPNLTSLILQKKVKELLIENAPKLVEVSICDYQQMFSDVVRNLLPSFSSCISQLEILTMELRHCEKIDRSIILELPPKLKKLVVIKTCEDDFELWRLTDLIKASPYLQEFCLELKYWRPLSTYIMRVNSTIMFPHEHLKVFKFCGYCSRAGEVEILKYIVVNCVALEKVIIDPHYEKLYGRAPECSDKSIRKQAVRDYLKPRLKRQVPEQIELVVL